MHYVLYANTARGIPRATWERLRADVERLLDVDGATLVKDVVLSGEQISFSDRLFTGDIFRLNRRPAVETKGEPARRVCDTFGFPYDSAVRGTLLLALHHAGRHFRLASSATEEKWHEARHKIGRFVRDDVAVDIVGGIEHIPDDQHVTRWMRGKSRSRSAPASRSARPGPKV